MVHSPVLVLIVLLVTVLAAETTPAISSVKTIAIAGMRSLLTFIVFPFLRKGTPWVGVRDAAGTGPTSADVRNTWDTPHQGLSPVRATRLGGPTARYMAGLAEAFQSLARRLPEDGSALVISHGGIIEAATVACLPDKDFSAWTVSSSYCEGVRLHVLEGCFVDAEPLPVAL